MDAIKHQGQRTDLTSTQVVSKLAAEKVSEDAGVSRESVRRYVRLTNLIPEVLNMVDEKKISFNPAVELSYLKPQEQQSFLAAMDYAQAAPSLSQAQRMKKKSQESGCSLDDMCGIIRAPVPVCGGVVWDATASCFPGQYGWIRVCVEYA